MHTLSGPLSAIAPQLRLFPLPVARAIFGLLVGRFGAACTADIRVELHPAGRSFGVDVWRTGLRLTGEPGWVLDSRWLVGPRGAVQRETVKREA